MRTKNKPKADMKDGCFTSSRLTADEMRKESRGCKGLGRTGGQPPPDIKEKVSAQDTKFENEQNVRHI